MSVQEQVGNENASIQELVRYRIRAQSLANSDENVYEVRMNGKSGEMGICLLRKGEAPLGISEDGLYVESYLLDYPTSGISQSMKLPYLKRCR